MTFQLLADHQTWRDDLIVHLRMKDVPGDRIGDILLEVESHLRQTGETPLEAFGQAKEYADAQLAMNPRIAPEGTSIAMLTGIGLASFAGAALYASGIIAIGKDGDTWFGLNPWLPFLTGAVILVAGLMLLPADLVRHPETGAPLLGDTKKMKTVTHVVLVAIGIALYALGRILA